MFKDSKAFSGFSVDDLEKAKDFYGNLLGIELVDNPMGMVELKLATGGHVIIYPKPNHAPATYTVLNFPVKSVDDAVDALTAKGIIFEKYDGMQQDEKGIARGGRDKGPTIAWFKDPAGNILSVLETK